MRKTSRMKRALAIPLGALLVASAGIFAGFRLWLADQPEETRIAVEAFGPIEFAFVAFDHFFPRPIDDFAAYGRRPPGARGRSPWVFRSSLDGRPRMLTLALAPGIWLAYATETATPHQLWRGEVELSGPAFDGRHGREPASRGLAWWRPPQSPGAWRVRGEAGFEPARVRWRGHGFDPKSGALWLRFEVLDRAGRGRIVVERPELQAADSSGGDAAQGLGIERIFEIAEGDGPEIALALASGAGRIEGDRLPDGSGLIALAPGRVRIVQTFGAPTQALDVPADVALEASAFADFDCETCHHVHERIVGPAWREIARRHAGADASAAAAILATSIVEGSVGRWGQVAMPPHADLTRPAALALARLILATELEIELHPEPEPEPEPGATEGVPSADRAREWVSQSASGSGAAVAAVATTYDYDAHPPPETLHPALRSVPIRVPGFTPRVGGLAFLPDGRLAVSTWDRDGAVFVLSGWASPVEGVRVERIADGLHEPLGLVFADGALHVIQKQEITRLVDADGDGLIDEYRTLATGWSTTSNFHEFGFGLPEIEGALHAGLSVCVLEGGKSCREQTPDRGTLVRVSLATGELERIASGLRTPNGVAATPTGELLVTDNQGDWLPANKLIRVETGADYGWRPPGERPDPARVTPPTVWLPQNEIGNSPTQPVVPTRGPYAGHVLFGDVFNGGIKRAFLEEVAGRWQGAAFHFSGGLQAPVNRMIEAPDGSLVVGEVGSGGNWGEFGKPWHGLEVLRFADEAAFEPMEVRLRSGGFDVVFSRPLTADLALAPDAFRVEDWYYVPTPAYGGPKHDVRPLPARAVRVSADRRIVSLDLPGLEAGRVVHLRLDPAIRSERGEALWIDEAWYTLNVLAPESSHEALAHSQHGASHDAEADAEDEAGDGAANGAEDDAEDGTVNGAEDAGDWRPLFDGVSFEGWRNYRGAPGEIEGWIVRDGALEFTRDTSVAGLIFHHLNPFATPALDLMTEERFGDFELALEWQVEPGGNSGIFYLVPDETDRLGWTRSLEMQVLDDARHADGQLEKRRAGDLYDVVASSKRMTRPAGEWNAARIRVDGQRITHWLNGEKIVEIERGSPEWNRALAASKHAGSAGYGLAREGHILLQDHGDIVRYRNIVIRRLRPD